MSKKQPLLIKFRGAGVSAFRKPKSKVDQALSIAKSNKKKLSTVVEHSQAGTVTSTDVFNATPVVDLIPATGDGLKTRITSASVKGTIKRNVDSNLIDDWRVDLVLDRMPEGTEVTPLVLYGSATPPIGAFKNILYKERFKILRSEMGTFDESGNGKAGHIINWYVRLNLIAKSNTANSFTQAAIQNNAIYLIYWTTATANQPIPVFQSRLICADPHA